MKSSERIWKGGSSALVLALAIALTYLAIEGAALLLGRELSWFGKLSSTTAAAIRYGLLVLALVLVAVAAYKHRRAK